MATKKQKRVAALAKREKFMEQYRQAGLKALAEDRERRAKEREKAAKELENGSVTDPHILAKIVGIDNLILK